MAHPRKKFAFISAIAAGLLLVPQAAFADSYSAGGNATTSIRYIPDFRKIPVSAVLIDYDNGIGFGGNNTLYLRLCKYSGTGTPDCSANPAVALTETGRTYFLGRLPKGTKYTIQYRAASNPGANPYWHGTVGS